MSITIERVSARAQDTKRLTALLARPQMESSESLTSSVAAIINEVRAGGDAALVAMGQRYDQTPATALWASSEVLAAAENRLDSDLIDAIDTAIDTIRRFHAAGKPSSYEVETAPGVVCQALWRPLDAVGLYVPAGGAPLPSTAIMLGVPAQLAGCQQVVLATPPGPDGRPDPAVLMIAHRLGIERVLVAGGAQAVAAMAYGTESCPKATKIFGPGNRFVTEAKRLASLDIDGAAMDMPAGPSEVMVIADHTANPDFVACDLLSQAEHGPDSQVVLLTPSNTLAEQVIASLMRYLPTIGRAKVAEMALAHARVLVVDDLNHATTIANQYAPEHLILAGDTADQWVSGIQTAGSVFVGHHTPEALGDYISGTNHVLPTGGWAKVYAGLSVSDFMRRMTVQQATAEGLRNLGPKGARLATHEGLDAHRLAIEIRLNALDQPAVKGRA